MGSLFPAQPIGVSWPYRRPGSAGGRLPECWPGLFGYPVLRKIHPTKGIVLAAGKPAFLGDDPDRDRAALAGGLSIERERERAGEAVGMAAGPRTATPGRASDEAALSTWARELSFAHFGVPFPGDVRFAPRLHHRAGDFTPATGVIRISRPYLERYGEAAGRAVLLHELCHWWLWRQGTPHREDSPVFRSLLHLHGAPLQARPMPRRTLEYMCPRCRARYRLPVVGQRRACGRCCRRFAGGRFDPQFTLIRVAEASP